MFVTESPILPFARMEFFTYLCNVNLKQFSLLLKYKCKPIY